MKKICGNHKHSGGINTLHVEVFPPFSPKSFKSPRLVLKHHESSTETIILALTVVQKMKKRRFTF